MKRSKTILIFIIGVILGALAAAGVYFLTVGDVAWQEYLETKLIPNAVIVFSAVGSLAVAAIPVINRVHNELDKFGMATKNINYTIAMGKKANECLKAQDAKIESFNKRFDEFEKYLSESVGPILKSAQNTENILRIGFCNTTELIEKGFAEDIAKVGVSDEAGKDKDEKAPEI